MVACGASTLPLQACDDWMCTVPVLVTYALRPPLQLKLLAVAMVEVLAARFFNERSAACAGCASAHQWHVLVHSCAQHLRVHLRCNIISALYNVLYNRSSLLLTATVLRLAMPLQPPAESRRAQTRCLWWAVNHSGVLMLGLVAATQHGIAMSSRMVVASAGYGLGEGVLFGTSLALGCICAPLSRVARSAGRAKTLFRALSAGLWVASAAAGLHPLPALVSAAAVFAALAGTARSQPQPPPAPPSVPDQQAAGNTPTLPAAPSASNAMGAQGREKHMGSSVRRRPAHASVPSTASPAPDAAALRQGWNAQSHGVQRRRHMQQACALCIVCCAMAAPSFAAQVQSGMHAVLSNHNRLDALATLPAIVAAFLRSSKQTRWEQARSHISHVVIGSYLAAGALQ